VTMLFNCFLSGPAQLISQAAQSGVNYFIYHTTHITLQNKK